MRFKRKLRTIVAVCLVVAALGSTAAIFGLSRAPGEENPGIIISPVGYMDGTTRGTGKYFSNARTITFSKEFFESGGIKYNSTSVNDVTGFHAVEGEFTATRDGYKMIEDDVTGDTYLSITTNKYTGTTPAERATSMLSIPFSNRGTGVSNRHGVYTLEYDIMIPEQPDMNADGKITESDYSSFMHIALTDSYSVSSADFYTSTVYYPTKAEGYYTISNWGIESFDQPDKMNVLLKYGEWYNIRHVYYFESGSSTKYKMKLYINDQEIVEYNPNYNMLHNGGTLANNVQNAPQIFGIMPHSNAYGATFYFDNIYAYRAYGADVEY